MSGTRNPTGTITEGDGTRHLVLTRTYRGAPEDVWAAVTDPTRLNRWFGDWRGDPGTGRVEVAMTVEEQPEDGPVYTVWTIEVCDPPHRLRVLSPSPGEGPAWRIALHVRDEGGGTSTVELAQEWHEQWDAGEIGPGWEFYLDRLVAALTGADPAAVTFEPYLELSDAYRALATRQDPDQ